jgi:hypothetical protein
VRPALIPAPLDSYALDAPSTFYLAPIQDYFNALHACEISIQ